MGFFRTALAVTGWGSLGTAVGFTLYTRKSKIYDVPPTDYLLGTTLIARFNPYNNPAMKDICVRKVPIDQIRPELLENERKLVEAYCAGVWSGWGYSIQRRYLQRKWQSPETASQLWSVKDLKESTYDVGTLITDHFEVLNKTENSIILRCGDTPRRQEVRADDGLFELTADVKKDEGVVEFGMKSVFYNGIAAPDSKEAAPLGGFVQWLHQKYDKLLMESAIRNCTR